MSGVFHGKRYNPTPRARWVNWIAILFLPASCTLSLSFAAKNLCGQSYQTPARGTGVIEGQPWVRVAPYVGLEFLAV